MSATPGYRPGGWGLVALTAVAGLCALLVAIGLAVSIGEIAIPLPTTFKALANRLWGAGYEISRVHAGVVWEYRLSRALVAACCGTGLALTGVVLQALLRNPLAEPYVLGISAGASVGAVSVMILGFGAGALTLSGGAFIGAILAFAFVILLARGARGSSDRTILAGVAGSQLFNAMTAYIVTSSADAEQARGVMFWLLGNLGGVRWPDVYLAAIVAAIGFAICAAHARALDAFTFGEDAAATLGIPVQRIRLLLFGATALMTASLVSIVGSIGFVGLVIPHAARMLVGSGHGRLLPTAAIIGAIFMVVADILSRVVVPGQILPIGVVTALFGAPAFAFLLYKARAPE